MEFVEGAASAAVRAVWGSVGRDVASAASPPASGAGGGGFEMDEGELDAVIGLWEEEGRKIVEDQQTIDRIVGLMEPPAGDDVSVDYVHSGLESLFALKDQNASMLAYVEQYVEKLKVAKTGMVTREDNTKAAFSALQMDA